MRSADHSARSTLRYVPKALPPRNTRDQRDSDVTPHQVDQYRRERIGAYQVIGVDQLQRVGWHVGDRRIGGVLNNGGPTRILDGCEASGAIRITPMTRDP